MLPHLARHFGLHFETHLVSMPFVEIDVHLDELTKILNPPE